MGIFSGPVWALLWWGMAMMMAGCINRDVPSGATLQRDARSGDGSEKGMQIAVFGMG